MWLHAIRDPEHSMGKSCVTCKELFIFQDSESPPPARGPVYPPGTPVHQDYGTTPVPPESPAQAVGGPGHLYPPAYDATSHHGPSDDGDAFQVPVRRYLPYRTVGTYPTQGISFLWIYWIGTSTGTGSWYRIYRVPTV